MSYFNIIAQTTENTVVTEYEPVKTRSGNYQSEAALEKEFIRMLTEQGYEYLKIHKENDLINNLRDQLENLITIISQKLNGTDSLKNVLRIKMREL